MKWQGRNRMRAVWLGVMISILAGGDITHADFTFGEPANLGPPVNTAAGEVPGGISPDGLELYFMDAYTLRPGNLGGHDLWVARRSSVSEPWGEPVNLGTPINSEHDDAMPCLTRDGLSLYFGSTRPGGPGDSDVYVVTRTSLGDEWGEPMLLDGPVNGPAWDGYPFISVDELTLYFSSYREGGYGDADFYVATRPTTDDAWGEPVNLGPEMNSSEYDACPYLAPDGLALFFHSLRPGGYGQADLWVATRSSTSEPWTTPVCLPPHINSRSAEATARIAEDGLTCYFCSNCPGGQGDLDVFQAPILPIMDFDSDGSVGLNDLLIMVECWGQSDPMCDIGPTPFGDGTVDVADLDVLMEYWGQEVEFLHNPRLASMPKPRDDSISDVEEALALGWITGKNATEHDVYVGTDPEAVENANASDTTGIYRGRQAASEYTLPDTVLPGQTFYWRIDEVSAETTLLKGDLWSFSVAEYLIVDDMESSQAIWLRWFDGWGDPNNGSEVWGTELSVVHSGAQSMLLFYDTTSTPIAQIQRFWDIPQDLTRKGVETLTLWIHGGPDLVAESFHMSLQDSAGNTAVIQHPDPEQIFSDSWQEWSITLADFSGLDLSTITSMSIVIGDAVDGQGSAGVLYIDDIYLHPVSTSEQ